MSPYRATEIEPAGEAFETFCSLDPPLDPGSFATADALFCRYGRSRHLLLHEGERAVGRLTASLNPRVRGDAGEQVGYVGAQVFPNDAGALRALLDPALAWLREGGCSLVRAPVTFHTWHPFRFVTGRFAGETPCGSGVSPAKRLPRQTEGFSQPTLRGEPKNPPHHPALFEDEGFCPIAWYVSMETTALEEMIDAAGEELRRYEQGPLQVRPLDPSRAGEELAAFHRLILASFQENVSYSPIGFEEFAMLYAGAAGQTDPRLIFICEDLGPTPRTEDGLAGLMYCVADRSDPEVPTIVLKTLAVHPAYRGDGLGGALTAVTHKRALELGFTRAVHALMRTGRPPASVSTRAMRVYRRYTLTERAL